MRCSRTRGEDNPPKTRGSQRTINLRPEVVAVLRDARPPDATADSFVFTTPTGLPLDTDRFVEGQWHRALRAASVRPRKFYATRHTFISVALSRGCSATWLATYCGTSLEMLDRHDARWMNDAATQLALLGGGARASEPAPEPDQDATRPSDRTLHRNPAPRAQVREPPNGGGRFELSDRVARSGHVFGPERANSAPPPTHEGSVYGVHCGRYGFVSHTDGHPVSETFCTWIVRLASATLPSWPSTSTYAATDVGVAAT